MATLSELPHRELGRRAAAALHDDHDERGRSGRSRCAACRASLSEPHLRTTQAIYDTDGGVRLVDSRALMEYAEDGHDHWHIQGVMLYQMWSDNGVVRRGTKVGFCFLDSRPWILALPERRSGVVYGGATCGDRGDLTQPDGPVGRMGRRVPGELRVPVDRHHRRWRPATTRSRRAPTSRTGTSSRTRQTTARGRACASRAPNGPVERARPGPRLRLPPPATTARVERQYGSEPIRDGGRGLRGCVRAGRAGRVRRDRPPTSRTRSRPAPQPDSSGGPIILVDANCCRPWPPPSSSASTPAGS